MAVTLKYAFDGQAFTVGYPEATPEVSPRFHGIHKFSQEWYIWRRQCKNVYPNDMAQIVQDNQRDGEQYNLHISQCIYCRLCEEVCPVDAILLTQNLGLVTDTKNGFVYNEEQLKNVPWYKGINPFNSRSPDRNMWVGEDEGKVDYQ